jgi:hypothetical protein
MKRLMISGSAAVALLAVATTMLWSHTSSTGRTVGSAGMTSLQDHRTPADINKLPIENFEDMSLVYSTATQARDRF